MPCQPSMKSTVPLPMARGHCEFDLFFCLQFFAGLHFQFLCNESEACESPLFFFSFLVVVVVVVVVVVAGERRLKYYEYWLCEGSQTNMCVAYLFISQVSDQ